MDDHALNILLVDDVVVDVMTVQRTFARAKVTNRMFVARDGIEALEMLRSDRVPAARRLVLLDLNMPRMTGIEFLREVRRDPVLRTLTVVVLATSNEDRDRVQACELEVAGYLVKPGHVPVVRAGDGHAQQVLDGAGAAVAARAAAR